MAIVARSFGKLLATIKSRGKNKCRTKADRGCGRRTVRMGLNGRVWPRQQVECWGCGPAHKPHLKRHICWINFNWRPSTSHIHPSDMVHQQPFLGHTSTGVHRNGAFFFSAPFGASQHWQLSCYLTVSSVNLAACWISSRNLTLNWSDIPPAETCKTF